MLQGGFMEENNKINKNRREFIKYSIGAVLFGSTVLCASCSGKVAKIDHKKCIACKACVSECPHKALSYRGGKINVDRTKCTGCGECIQECSFDAISI